MLARLLLVCSIGSVLTLTLRAETAPEPDVLKLIDALMQVKEPGLGYCGSYAGTEFLPYEGSGHVSVLILNQAPLKESAEMKALVKLGVKAIPELLKHLNDTRPTQIPQAKNIMWTMFKREYDFNRRTALKAPEGVNKEANEGEIKKDSFSLGVGDLCFVALGQIVNRGFNAARYQPTGGMVVCSPFLMPEIIKAAKAEFGTLTPETHKKLLLDDLATPDHENRRIGAYQRLSFYYPEAVEDLVLKQLSVPTYDIFQIEPFVREGLYKEPDAAKRKTMLSDFIASKGPQSKDGLLRELFEDLDMQEANEQKRLSPPLKEKYLAREILIESFNFPATVKSTDRPVPTYWEGCEKARFIETLVHDNSKAIDEAIAKELTAIESDDYLALACMKRLLDRHQDEAIIRYCKRRIPVGNDYADELSAVLKRVQKD